MEQNLRLGWFWDGFWLVSSTENHPTYLLLPTLVVFPLAFPVFVALDGFFKQKLAFADKNTIDLLCFPLVQVTAVEGVY